MLKLFSAATTSLRSWSAGVSTDRCVFEGRPRLAVGGISSQPAEKVADTKSSRLYRWTPADLPGVIEEPAASGSIATDVTVDSAASGTKGPENL